MEEQGENGEKKCERIVFKGCREMCGGVGEWGLEDVVVAVAVVGL